VRGRVTPTHHGGFNTPPLGHATRNNRTMAALASMFAAAVRPARRDGDGTGTTAPVLSDAREERKRKKRRTEVECNRSAPSSPPRTAAALATATRMQFTHDAQLGESEIALNASTTDTAHFEGCRNGATVAASSQPRPLTVDDEVTPRDGNKRKADALGRPSADAIYKRSQVRDPAWEKRLQQIRAVVDRMRSGKLAPPLPSQRVREDLTRPRHIWREFFRQDDAFAFSRSCRKAVHVFSVEIGEDGRRRFIAATHSSFWARYAAMAASDRHHYEVIPEAAPCKLYFDVEYSRESHPELIPHEHALVETLIDVVRSAVRSVYGFDPNPATSIIDLESTTEKKFSRHLVFTDVVFADNREMGSFVAQHVVAAAAASSGSYLLRSSRFDTLYCSRFDPLYRSRFDNHYCSRFDNLYRSRFDKPAALFNHSCTVLCCRFMSSTLHTQ
jgi:hypothetical protein